MPATSLKHASVYASEVQMKQIDAAAEADGRSKSNFLLWCGLQRAKELGIGPGGAVMPEKSAASG